MSSLFHRAVIRLNNAIVRLRRVRAEPREVLVLLPQPKLATRLQLAIHICEFKRFIVSSSKAAPVGKGRYGR